MEQAILHDKDEYPTEEIIFSHIGKSKNLWQSFFDFIHSNYSEFSEEWRYYNDGKSWLMKVQKKSKTIFWLSLFQNTFRTTFYFTDKAEKLISESGIPEKLKEEFKGGKHFNKIRGITILFKTKKDVEYAKELMGIKATIK